MNFLFPGVLFALSVISIPIIIHLFNFRRYKKVLFPNVRLLQDIKKETKKKQKLRHILILFARILLLSCIVIAFAQPYITGKDTYKPDNKRYISIYLDNSFSMEYTQDNISAFNIAKTKASEIINAFEDFDHFNLMTNSESAEEFFFHTKEEVRKMVYNAEVIPQNSELSSILSRHKALFKDKPDSPERQIYIISDFQKFFFDHKNVAFDSSTDVFFVPLDHIRPENVFIDSVWFEQAVAQVHQPIELKVNLKKEDPDDYFDEVSMQLFLNSEKKSITNVSFSSNEFMTSSLSFSLDKTGSFAGYVEIDEDNVSFDNTFYLAFSILDRIEVLSIFQDKDQKPLNVLFGSDTLFNYHSMHYESIDYALFQNNHVIILQDLEKISTGLQTELIRFAERGGTLLVFPGIEIDFESYQNFLSKLNTDYFVQLDTSDLRTNYLNKNHRIFENVFTKLPEKIDLPMTYKHYVFSNKTKVIRESILKIENDDPILISAKYGNGNAFISSVGITSDFSNLSSHPIFVPLMYQIAFQSIPNPILYNTIDHNIRISLDDIAQTKDPIFKIINDSFPMEIIPQVQKQNNNHVISFDENIQKAGIYKLFQDNEFLRNIALNYDRNESEMNFFSPDELSQLIKERNWKNVHVIQTPTKELSAFIVKENRGIPLWKYFVFAALAFAFIEVLLIRFMKG